MKRLNLGIKRTFLRLSLGLQSRLGGICKPKITALILIGLSAGFLYGSASTKDIQWQSFADGIARGKSENKKVFLHFYADWCGACEVMQKKTFKDPGVIAALNENFIPIKVNVDREKETSAMFRIQLLPDNWFIAENTEIIGHRPGYIPPEQLKDILRLMMDEKTGQ